MKRLSLLGVVAALGLATTAIAQDQEEPPALTDVWMFAAKTGMRAELRDGFKEYFELRKAAGDSRDYMLYVPVVSETMGRIMVRACCFDWTDQDAYGEERDSVEGMDGKFGELVRPYVDHVHRYLERNDWENSHVVEDKFDGPYYGETTWMLAEGFYPEAGEARRTMSQELLDGWASDDNQWLWLMRIGGKPAMKVVNSFENWADMAPPEQTVYDYMVEKHGEEKTATLFSQFMTGKASSSYTVWRRDDEASLINDE